MDLSKRTRNDDNRHSTSGIKTGNATGTLISYQKKGRAYGVGSVKIGGRVEQLCFESALVLNPGDRISFTKIKDSTCTTGAKATRIKVL